MIRKANIVTKNSIRGGSGDLEFHYILSAEELADHGRMFARMIFKPGSCTKWHQHEDSKEIYYVLSGTGRYTDADGSVHTISAGDVCLADYNHWHCVENTSLTENLEVIGIILNEVN